MNDLTNNLAIFAEATSHDILCSEYGWLESCEETEDFIADFENASKQYNESSIPKYGQIAGFRFISFSKVQVRKGDQRQPLSILDLGVKRYAISCDLSDYLLQKKGA